MTVKRKKAIIIILVLLIIAAVIAFCVSYYSPIKASDNITILNITRYDGTDRVDITDEIDHDTLCKILPMLRVQRISKIQNNLFLENAEYEISGYNLSKKYHHFRLYVETGKDSYFQLILKGRHGKEYKIKNSESWIEIIKALEEAD